VIDRAERIRDAVLAAVPDQGHAHVPERLVAVRAGVERGV
jgi:hypothetical protein